MAHPTKKSRLAKEQRAKHPTNFTTVLQLPHSIDDTWQMESLSVTFSVRHGDR